MLKLGGANDAHVGAGAMSLARLQVVIGAEGLLDVAFGEGAEVDKRGAGDVR